MINNNSFNNTVLIAAIGLTIVAGSLYVASTEKQQPASVSVQAEVMAPVQVQEASELMKETVFVIKTDRFSRGSHESIYVNGYGPVVEDFSTNKLYGGMDVPLIRSDYTNRTEYTPAEIELQKKAFVEFNQILGKLSQTTPPGDEIARELLAIVNRHFQRNLTNALPPKIPSGIDEYVSNLVTRKTACGDVALSLATLLYGAGFQTRIIRLSLDLEKLGIANHVAVEYYSNDQNKWVFLEGMKNYSPVKNGRSLSIFEVYKYPDVMAELSTVWVGGFYNLGNTVNIMLPDPDYSSTIQLFWTPVSGVVENGRKFHESSS